MSRGARSLAMRRQVQREISARLKRLGLTQSQAGVKLGVSQPRVNALVRGRIELFSLDALVDLATRLGLKADLRVGPRRR